MTTAMPFESLRDALAEDIPVGADRTWTYEFAPDDEPVLSMLSDLMEEVRSLRARLDELFPKAEETSR